MIGISRIITLIITITHVKIINTIRRTNVVIFDLRQNFGSISPLFSKYTSC